MTTLWRAPRPLLLASASATRRALLEGAGLPVESESPGVDERGIEAPLAAARSPAPDIAQALARAKALAVSERHPGRLVLGADQTLSLGNRAFHKPGSPEAARRQIAMLSGETHALDSAAALAHDGVVLFETVARATMTMRRLSDGFIDRYVAAAGPGITGSVGGYKLEGLGIHLFEAVEGDHATVLGLPLMAVLAALRRLGALAG